MLDFRPTYAFVETSILLSMGHPLSVASYAADTLKRKQALMLIVSELNTITQTLTDSSLVVLLSVFENCQGVPVRMYGLCGGFLFLR